MINFKKLNEEILNKREELVKRTKNALFKLEDELKRSWSAFNLELLDLEFYTPGYESGEKKLVLMFDKDEKRIIVAHKVNYWCKEKGTVESFFDNKNICNAEHFMFEHYKNKGISDFQLDICEEIVSHFDVIEEKVEEQIKEEIERLNNLLKKVKQR